MKLPERPAAVRIQEILDNRQAAVQRMRMGYTAARDYLQLCAEIDHLRAELREATEQKDLAWISAGNAARDTERLDCLESQGKGFVRGTDVQKWSVESPDDDPNWTVRSAIDAFMAEAEREAARGKS